MYLPVLFVQPHHSGQPLGKFFLVFPHPFFCNTTFMNKGQNVRYFCPSFMNKKGVYLYCYQVNT